jgi:hypothetical protein
VEICCLSLSPIALKENQRFYSFAIQQCKEINKLKEIYTSCVLHSKEEIKMGTLHKNSGCYFTKEGKQSKICLVQTVKTSPKPKSPD